MFLNYGIQNYKSLSIKSPLNMANLTILAGSNNTGKSAFIKSMIDLTSSDEFTPTRDPCIPNFITKVFNKQKSRKIGYKHDFKITDSTILRLEIKFAYSIKSDMGFISDYNISILENNKIIKYLKLKKKNIEDDYNVDAYLMLELLSGKLTKALPKRYQGTVDVIYMGYHPIRVILDLTKDPIMMDHFENKDLEKVQFNISEIFEIISFNNYIRYIGPLRSSPEEYYIIEKSSNKINPTGDNAVEVLNKLKKEEISHYITLDKNETLTNESLYSAVQRWINFFFGKTNFKVSKVSENLVQVLINGHSIKNSGFGYSQLLPIIIQALLLNENNILLLEQPEIHLHPDLEIKLAFFLLCMSRANKQIIVETHSEHIINSLIIEKLKHNYVNDNFKIYFFEKNIDESIARINPVEIGTNGEIKNWPEGFFDQYYKFSRELIEIRKNLRDKNRKERLQKKEVPSLDSI